MEIKYRDHAGVFTNPDLKKDSFFEAITAKMIWRVEFSDGQVIKIPAHNKEMAESYAIRDIRKKYKHAKDAPELKSSELI